MGEPLRDGVDNLSADTAAPYTPAGHFKEAPKYDPEAAAYAPSTTNPYDDFKASIDSGATISLSLACADNRREYIELNATESARWVIGTLTDRLSLANRKIRERRAKTAVRAAARLRERNLTPSTSTLTPDEDACLREFGALVEQSHPLAQGGYAEPTLELQSVPVTRLEQALRENFWDGFGGDGGGVGYGYEAPTQREYLPRGGPAMQQLLISDVWDEQAKAYYAWTHDPIARQGCELIADFVLGRGVSINAADDTVQAAIDEFWKREGFDDQRLHDFAVALSRDGEIFARKIPLGDGRLKLRSAPPETIWEIVTDAEDPLTVFWYVQRFQTRFVQFAQGVVPAQARWIERTVLDADMIHIKVNGKESDVRGRSDLFPVLGWLKRLRDYFDAIIQKEYAAAAYQWHYKINGGATDIERLTESVLPKERPNPGSYFLSNDLVDVSAIASTVRTVSGEGSAYEALLNQIAVGIGLSADYFGATSHSNRASALISTEPAAKRFEARQDVMRGFLKQVIDAVIAEAQLVGRIASNAILDYNIVFPSIITADSQTRVTLLRLAEASGYIAKQTAAEETASELDLENYDFDAEIAKLQAEIGQDPLKLIAHDQQMVKKGAPAITDLAFDPGEVPNPDYAGGSGGPAAPKVPEQPQSTSTASPTSATGAAKIRNEQGRGGAVDRSTMESDAALRAAARRRGAILILP